MQLGEIIMPLLWAPGSRMPLTRCALNKVSPLLPHSTVESSVNKTLLSADES